jgi:hypothetical protein
MEMHPWQHRIQNGTQFHLLYDFRAKCFPLYKEINSLQESRKKLFVKKNRMNKKRAKNNCSKIYTKN